MDQGFWKGGGDLALVVGCLVVTERMSHRMEKSGFDDTDYSVVVKIRRSRPIAWRWEIYRAGRKYPIGQSPVFFRTMAAANKAGKAHLSSYWPSDRSRTLSSSPPSYFPAQN